jgi:hypothetical protein
MPHTPGPWEARPNDGQIILNGSNCYDIQEIFNDAGGFNPADIRLMAAAPDMLAALKMWMELETTCDGRRICYCDDPEVAQHGKCYACVAEAAISKAEGRD